MIILIMQLPGCNVKILKVEIMITGIHPMILTKACGEV